MLAWPPCQLHRRAPGQGGVNQQVPKLRMLPSALRRWQVWLRLGSGSGSSCTAPVKCSWNWSALAPCSISTMAGNTSASSGSKKIEHWSSSSLRPPRPSPSDTSISWVIADSGCCYHWYGAIWANMIQWSESLESQPHFRVVNARAKTDLLCWHLKIMLSVCSNQDVQPSSCELPYLSGQTSSCLCWPALA